MIRGTFGQEAFWTGGSLDRRPSEQEALHRRPSEQEALWTGGHPDNRPPVPEVLLAGGPSGQDTLNRRHSE